MKCTEDTECKEKIQKKRLQKEEKKRTSSILKIISKHKFISSIVAMFISFSILNGILIVNFMTVLENSIYI